MGASLLTSQRYRPANISHSSICGQCATIQHTEHCQKTVTLLMAKRLVRLYLRWLGVGPGGPVPVPAWRRDLVGRCWLGLVASGSVPMMARPRAVACTVMIRPGDKWVFTSAC
jgi:hypothetical protein